MTKGPVDAGQIESFAKVLRQLWSDEPWIAVEPYAQRAWQQLSELDDQQPSWEQVRDQVMIFWTEK